MKPSAYYTLILLAVIVAWSFTGCVPDEFYQSSRPYSANEYATLQKTLNLPNEPVSYDIVLPAHMGGFMQAAANEMALLGRVLFYDKNLSKNKMVSCASCHHQELAFSDSRAFSVGFDGQLTSRNSLALGATPGFENSYQNQSFVGNSNLAIKPAGFLWDERAMDIRSQSEIALLDPVEMGMEHMEAVSERIRAQPYYQVLFKKAFGETDIQHHQILRSIEAFVNAMASTDSRFDAGLNHTKNQEPAFPNFSPLENAGKKLYLDHCSSCHGTRMVGLSENLANNGLELDYKDAGRQKLTRHDQDKGVFKVPMLRNVALTAPYMHDGRFATLEEVIEHYSNGITLHPNLHKNLRNSDQTPKRLNFSNEEKRALLAFLHTLTDEKITKDVRFSNPFKK
jgi:cytochrome c peroxidase